MTYQSPQQISRSRFAARLIFNYAIAPLLLGFVLIGLIWMAGKLGLF